MRNLIFYFLSLFIIFFACTQQKSVPGSETATTSTTEVENTPKPVKKLSPDRVPQPVPQAAKEDLVYPEAFKEFDIPKFKGATITNNLILENSKGKFGQRLMMDCPGELPDVFEFYDKAMKQNGWERLPSMDKQKEDNDFHYRSALYEKDNYNFSMSLMDVRQGKVAVNQILKER